MRLKLKIRGARLMNKTQNCEGQTYTPESFNYFRIKLNFRGTLTIYLACRRHTAQ